MSSPPQVNCSSCGATMLATTAARTGGLCMACKRGIRQHIEDAKIRYQQQRQADPLKDRVATQEFTLSNLFLLRQTTLWGDYGDVLASGYISRDGAGRALLHRGGPFTPPLFFPWSSLCGHILIVTGSFRQELERAPFAPLTFNPAVKDRIVHLPFAWERWDRNADTPRKHLRGGEPEAYIGDEPHSASVAAAMPDFWEVLPPVLPCTIKREESRSLDVPDRYYFTARAGADYHGLFRNRDTWFDLVVDQTARDWFQQRVGEWVSFQPLIER